MTLYYLYVNTTIYGFKAVTDATPTVQDAESGTIAVPPTFPAKSVIP